MIIVPHRKLYCTSLRVQYLYSIRDNIHSITCLLYNRTLKIMRESLRRKPLTCRKSDKLYHIILNRVHLARVGFELTLVAIGTDCIGSYKSNYHTTTTVLWFEVILHEHRYQWNIAHQHLVLHVILLYKNVQ